MRRPAFVVVLALLVALAGCSLIGGPTTETTTTTATTTTTETTTAGRLPAGDRPPGVNATALVDPDALLDAHTDRLLAAGFTHEFRVEGAARQEIGGEPRLVDVDRRAVVSAAPGAAEYRRVLVNAGTGARFDAWGNRTGEFLRVTVDNVTRYRVGQPSGRRDLAGATFLEPYLRASTFVLDGVGSGDNRTLVRFSARGLAPGVDPATVFPPGASNVSGYRAELAVDADGRIRRLVAGGTYAVGGERATFAVRYALTADGGITVSRPDWVGVVANRTAD
jgi:hypothetical protein